MVEGPEQGKVCPAVVHSFQLDMSGSIIWRA